METDHNNYARDYDEQLEKYGCYLAEVIFGLCYESIRKNETVLDIGIGTGASTRLFRLAGLKIFGLDNSSEMLEICREKRIAEETRQHDIQQIPWPYEDGSIDHIVCCGVTHFIAGLENIFTEAERIQREEGLFALTIMLPGGEGESCEKYELKTTGGFRIYSHRQEYIDRLMRQYGYAKTREISCYVGQDLFKVMILRKRKHLTG